MTGAIKIPAIKSSSIIAQRSEVTAAINMPAIKAAASIVSGSVMNAAIAIPAITVSGTIVHNNLFSAALEIPAILVQCLISQIQVATAAGAPARRAFVMNLSHFGVTEYSNFSFNSFSDYHGTGLYLASNEDGIFVLDGEDDAGVYINAYIQTGTEDLWAEFVKKLREGFVQKRGGPIAIDLILDEGRIATVTRETSKVTDEMHEEQVKFPRGLKNRFVSFALRNLGGKEFSLDSFKAYLDEVRRKIR